jgi:hypothetical protein
MRIHSLCLIKDESDIIEQCLTAAAVWCDRIYVYDNGSTDDTWEQVSKISERLPEVVPFKQEGKPFHDSLRAEIFQAFRADCADDDWWCLLGADEFYIDDPRVFLAKVPREQGVVWTTSFSYYFTDKDVERYRREPEAYADNVPVEDKCRYYLNHWSEIRFFRHHHSLKWEGTVHPERIYGWQPYPVRIWVKNYPYRSPQQIQKRLATRSSAVAAGQFLHEAMPDWASVIDPDRMRSNGREEAIRRAGPSYATIRWQERVVDASKLNFDAHDRRFVVNDDLMPSPSSPMSAPRRFVHAAIKHARAAKRRYFARG